MKRYNTMKLNKEQQKQIMKDNPMQGFDICSKCENVQLYRTMKDINEIDFDLICGECESEKDLEKALDFKIKKWGLE